MGKNERDSQALDANRPSVPLNPAIEDKLRKNSTRNPETGCHEWKGAAQTTWNGRRYLASRLAWAQANQRDPGPARIWHTCKNTRCVNPAHLSLQGRKLTPDDVREIRQRYSNGNGYVSMQEVAEPYDITPQTVSDIVSRRCWGWVD